MHERTNIQLSAADRKKLEIGYRPPQQSAKARLASEDCASDGRWSCTGNAKTEIWRWQERFGEN
jgi:hypothetical protein